MNRYDAILAPDWMYTKFKKTPEGFLTGRAVICSTGIYEYRRSDGSIAKELRLPDDVFAPSFLDSLRLKPLTLYHPPEMVTSVNVKDYLVGTLGDNPSGPIGLPGKPTLDPKVEQSGYQFYNTDMYHVSIDMMIHDAEAVASVENGLRALSVGYTCDLEPAEPGARYLGQSYDYIQRNLIANHVSLVDAARCGDAATIRMDSLDDAILVTVPVTIADGKVHKDSAKTMLGGTGMPELKTIKLDGVEYQAESKVLEALHVAQTKADGLATELADTNTAKTKIEAERDTLKDRVDALDAKVKELESKKLDEAVVAAAVARRVKILDAARVAEVEVNDGMSELDIQKAVIVKVFPKANLDGKSTEYIDARFDGAIEALAADAEEKANADTRAAAGGAENADAAAHADAGNVVDSREARKKMIETLRNGYRGDSK